MTASALEAIDLVEEAQFSGLLEAAGPDATREIMNAFWTSTDDLVARLKTELAAASFDEAARTAHALKGSSSNVGAARLAEAARAIEAACRSVAQNDADTAYDAIVSAFTATRAEFEDLLSRHG